MKCLLSSVSSLFESQFENDPVIPIANDDVSCGNPLVSWKTFWASATATWLTKKNAHFSVTVNAY